MDIVTPVSATAAEEAVVRHDLAFPEAGVTHLLFGWPRTLDAELGTSIIELMRHTSAGSPIIGFAEHISDAEAARYLQDLQANLAAGRCDLLAITASTGLLVGLCTLRRNANPNNRHIVDLAKGMIRQEFRGGAMLPVAFLEIARRCRLLGAELLTLDVRADTPAHAAWQRFGFETWGVLPDYARAQGRVHAGHFMMQKVEDLHRRAQQILQARSARSVQPA